MVDWTKDSAAAGSWNRDSAISTSALSLDGVDDYVAVPHSSSLAITSAVTVECWAKSATATWNNFGMLVSKRDAWILHPYLGTKNLAFLVFVDGLFYGGLASLDIDLTHWHHYVGTYDGATIRLYVDGVLVASEAKTGMIGVDTGSMFFGLDDGLARFFAGSMDEVRIYNRALSAAEVVEHYQNVFTNEAGLAGHWAFSEGTGTSAADSSGSGNTGALINGPTWAQRLTNRLVWAKDSVGAGAFDLECSIPGKSAICYLAIAGCSVCD